MAVLSLPLSFTNSFWSQDYRRGLEVLFEKLEQGAAENNEIVAFIRARAIAEGQLAASLINPGLTGSKSSGFGADDGASLLMAFRGLQAESVIQGQAHKEVSNELHTLVADPFDEWAKGYKERLKQNKATVLDNWLRSYEQAYSETAKLKQQYLAKTRRADEAEDDAKFAPNNHVDKYTSSPRMRPADSHRAPPNRTASVSERIASRLKEIQKKSVDALAAATTSDDHNEEVLDTNDKSPTKVDKGKGKAVDDHPPTPPRHVSPPHMSPLLLPKAELATSPDAITASPIPILLAGLSFSPASISQLLTRAAAELPLRPIRVPLLGEYQDCFDGEEFVAWLNHNVPGFGGNLDLAEDAARELTEREGLLRRIGELGNQFEQADDAFYQFRPKAFDVEHRNGDNAAKPLGPKGDNLIKRTGNFVNLVSKALNAPGEPTYLKARHDAEDADRAYRIAVRMLDRQRLGLEDRIEDTLKTLQRWEIERLRAVKTVLLQYHGTMANLRKGFDPSIERSATLIAAYQPESDLTALIERYRTGPFRPDPQVYESVAHDESDVLFGIDLRKWVEGGWHALTTGEEKKEQVPPVITALLTGLDVAYTKLQSDAEKRKTWIYEVPLPAVHHLRETLNSLPVELPIPADVIAKYDAPVLASAVKLWALELNPPLALYEGWEDFRRLYPGVGSGAKGESEVSEEQRMQDISAALQRWPKVHLYVLDAIVKHLKTLMETTTVEEDNEIYMTKLALSIGRTIIRPKVESELSIQDRHPTLLFIDLLKHYDVLIPPTIAHKKRESERKVPVRKRTAIVDMRLSRSRISVNDDMKQLLAAQQLAQNPSLARTKSPPPASPQYVMHSPLAAPQPTLPPPPPPLAAIAEQPKALTPPPPPPPILTPPPPPPPISMPTPPAPPPSFKSNNGPPRPSFKEPPPEEDDLPPRPSFREPPPEVEDTPPRPQFAEPPAEVSEYPNPTTPARSPIPSPVVPPPPPPQTTVIPPTPHKRTGVSSPPPSRFAASSRSPTPPSAGDVVLGSGRTSISRNGSAESTGRRMSRGPRPPGGSGNVSSLVSSLNRTNNSGTPSSPPTVTRHTNKLSGSAGRPSSVLGRGAAFSRRTMASDAEDDVVDRK